MNYATDINTPETPDEFLYREYFNDYLSVAKFATDKLMTESYALMVLREGRKFNHSRGTS